jgi:hypothetical protein
MSILVGIVIVVLAGYGVYRKIERKG